MIIITIIAVISICIVIASGGQDFKQFPKVLARKRLGTRWAKYPFSRCRNM